MKTYIYILQDPFTNQPRYIGKTIYPSKRLINHLYSKANTYCNKWIKSIIKKGKLPLMIIIDEIEGDWEWLEQYWIEQFKQWGFKLTNHTIGGEGNVGGKHNKDTLLKMSNSHKGKIVSKETRLLISKANKGRIVKQDQKLLISNSLKKYYQENSHPIKGTKRGTCNNKLQKEQVLEIRKLLVDGKTTLEIALIYNISKATVQQIKDGKTWQSLGEFKLIGKASRLKKEDLLLLYKMFDCNTKIVDIQKVLPYCITTIAKQRKLWKQIKES